jgi:hypothetical protein
MGTEVDRVESLGVLFDYNIHSAQSRVRLAELFVCHGMPRYATVTAQWLGLTEGQTMV